MEINRAAELLRALADGIDPMTGQPLPDESVYNRPEIIRALHCVLQELQERADSTAAVNAGRNWSTEEEAQLLQEYGMGLPIETIARRHGRSVGAIETRLSELGQRDQIQFSMRSEQGMERSRLELLLEQELLQNAQQARILCGSPVTRFVRSVQTAGGVAAVRESCRRNRPSDAFDSLVRAGRLDLSAEASAVKGKYGPLFTDEEVNTCLTLLLESGYFQKTGR